MRPLFLYGWEKNCYNMGKGGMGVSKKRKVAVYILTALTVALLLSQCVPVIHGPWSRGRVVYDNDYDRSITFEDDLTEEEVAAVVKVLSSNRSKIPFGYIPACSWDWDVAIILDGRRYMLATDTCGTIFVGSERLPNSYFAVIDISEEEQDILEEIFTSRGAEF